MPTAADALTIVINAGASSAITLSGSITVGSLDMTVTGARNGFLRASGFVLTVNGTADFNAVTWISNFPFAPLISYCEVDAGIAPGGFVFNGATRIHTTGAGDTYIGGANVGEGTMTFNANLTMGAWSYTNPGDEPAWAFDAVGAQTVTYSSNYHIKPSRINFGVANSPIVTVSAVLPGVGPGNLFTVYDGGLNVNNNSNVSLSNFDFDPWVSGCAITVNSTATLRMGDDNNFPGFGVATVNPTNYATYTISATSTVVYYGGLGQSISNLANPGYGHITYAGVGLKTSAGNFSIRGNWTNNGTFSAVTHTHTFNGTPNQTVGGTNPTTFYNVVENKASGSLLMGVNNNRVNNILTLTAGPLDLNSFTLIIGNSALAAVTRVAGYIISETNVAGNPSILQWIMGATTGAFIIPFGTTAGTYIPFTFNKTTATVSTTSVATRPTAGSANLPWSTTVTQMYSPALLQDGSDEAVIDRWWDITCSAATTANITFSYLGVENTMIVPYNTGNIGAQYWSAAWLPNSSCIGSALVVGAGVGAVTANGVSFVAAAFTPMVLSSLGAPLPVELISFTGTCQGDFATLAWATASETNNSHFDILRSDNGGAFEVVGTKQGAGTTSSMSDYTFVDSRPLTPTTFYRLAQYDFNGQSETYDPIQVASCLLNTSTTSAFGTDNNIVLSLNSEDDAVYSVTVFDMQGKVVHAEQISAAAGATRYSLNSASLNTGVYLVRIETQLGSAETTKVFVGGQQ